MTCTPATAIEALSRGQCESTDISVALDYLQGVAKRKTVSFLISDFWAEGFDRSLKLASRRHDLTCVRVSDPIEEKLEGAGFVAFNDAETGEDFVVDTSNKKVREAYKEAEIKRDEDLCKLFLKNGINTFKINTAEPVVTPFISYMNLRQKTRRRIK